MHLIDIIIISTYFIFIAYATFKSWGNIEEINTFSVGKKSFSTYALGATITATWVSGSGFFIDISDTYKKGWYYLLPALCMTLLLFLIAYVFAPRMKEFLGKTSVASAMGEIYGLKVRKLVAICGVICCCGPIAIQFKAVGYIGEYFFNCNPFYFIIPIGILVTVYCLSGGIISVVKTDIIQKTAFFITVPILFISCIYSFNHTKISPDVDYSKFDLLYVLTNPNEQFWEMIILAFYFIFPGFNPPAFQRISMGFNIVQVRKSWASSAVSLFVFTLFVSLIGWMLFLQNPYLKNNEMFSYLVENFLFTGLKGILIVGILAMTMSTADSFLNIGSVLMANDLYKIHSSNSMKLRFAKFFTLIIGVLSILLATSNQNLLPIILMTASFYVPIVSVPLIFTIFGYRSTERCILIGMISAIFVVLSLHLLKIFDIFILNPLFPGVLTNTIFLILSHYILEKRKLYTGIDDEGYFKNYKYFHSNKLYRMKHFLNNALFLNHIHYYSKDIMLSFFKMEFKKLGTRNEGEIDINKIIKQYKLSKKHVSDSVKELEKLRYIKREGNYIIINDGEY